MEGRRFSYDSVFQIIHVVAHVKNDVCITPWGKWTRQLLVGRDEPKDSATLGIYLKIVK